MLNKPINESAAASPHPNSTRCCLIETAKRIFARCGFEGASIRALAEEARTNVSAVSYHFAGKEGLYRAVIEPIAEKMKLLAEQTLKKPSSASDFRARLAIFIDSFFAVQAEEPEIVQILQRDFPAANEPATEVFMRSFLPIGEALKRFIREARESGLLKTSIDPDLSASMLMGTISGLGRFENMRGKLGFTPFLDETNRNHTVQAIVSQFCDGALETGR